MNSPRQSLPEVDMQRFVRVMDYYKQEPLKVTKKEVNYFTSPENVIKTAFRITAPPSATPTYTSLHYMPCIHCLCIKAKLLISPYSVS